MQKNYDCLVTYKKKDRTRTLRRELQLKPKGKRGKGMLHKMVQLETGRHQDRERHWQAIEKQSPKRLAILCHLTHISADGRRRSKISRSLGKTKSQNM
jgi:hypothetical protein